MAENFLHFMADLAERRIARAAEEGAFDNLPGMGKPLDLEDDSQVPEELRMAYKVLINAGYVPPEIADRKEIESILDLLERCDADGAEKLRQMRKLDVILMRMNARRERSVGISDGDPYYEKIVRRITLLKKKPQPQRAGGYPEPS